MSDVDFDLHVARKYLQKKDNAMSRGIEFTMTLTMLKNVLRAKKCYYTGISLTRKQDGQPLRPSDVTIDRVDASKGYIPGNVVACCHAANQLKSQLEKAGLPGLKAGRAVFDKTIKRMTK